MADFFKRHKAVHIWFLCDLLLLALYQWAVSSRQTANAFTGFTQRLKDGWACLWYLFPFSVVEWFYAAFIAGVIAWLAVLFHRVRTWRGRRLHAAYGCALGILCLFLTAGSIYCLGWGANYYADGFQEKSGVYAQPVTADELERVTLRFVEKLAETSDQVPRDQEGLFAVPREEIIAYSTQVYDHLSQ